jgi:RnfABCDGE-type electron transport complex B subunit
MKRGTVALIDEQRCIGCTRCIEACPVDAITGASGFMHAVVASWCIGCKLCLPPCPVDCIAMLAPPAPWTKADAQSAKRRYAARKARLARARTPAQAPDRRTRREVIAALLGRAKARGGRRNEREPR